VINFQTNSTADGLHSAGIPPRRGPEAASIPSQAERIGKLMNEMRVVDDGENPSMRNGAPTSGASGWQPKRRTVPFCMGI
jgi:hypothetical protein